MKAACLVALALAGVFALIQAGLLLRDARIDLQTQSSSFHEILKTANHAAVQADFAASQADAAMLQERDYFEKTSLEVYKTAAAARLVLVRTDRSLNDVLTPQLASDLRDTDELLRQTAADTHAAALGLQPSLDHLAQASAAAADAMADPHIAETLSNVDAGTKQAAIAAGNVASATLHVDTMTALAEKRLRQMLKPASLAERLFERLAGLGISAYGVAK